MVFVGDTVFSGCQTWFQASDPDRWLQSLDFLSTLDIEYVVPAHGAICKKDSILEQGAFIREWITAVAVGIANGWNKEECVARINFLDRYPMDVGLERLGPWVQKVNVERLYDYLHGKTERF